MKDLGENFFGRLVKISLDIVGVLLYNRRAVGDYAFEKFSLDVKKTLDIVGLLLYNRRAGAKLPDPLGTKIVLDTKSRLPIWSGKNSLEFT